MIFVIFVRICIELLAGIIGLGGGMILAGIGQQDKALTLAIVCGIVVFIARPNAEDRELFKRYQDQHAPPGHR